MVKSPTSTPDQNEQARHEQLLENPHAKTLYKSNPASKHDKPAAGQLQSTNILQFSLGIHHRFHMKPL
jgi:hypothetical protein